MMKNPYIKEVIKGYKHFIIHFTEGLFEALWTIKPKFSKAADMLAAFMLGG